MLHSAHAQVGATVQSNGHLIQLCGVVKTYETAAGVFTALKGINLTVESGELLGIVGKSGSGKSTLLNILAGIDRPSTGQVYIGGTAVHALGESQLAAWRGRQVGVVFQFFQLLPTLLQHFCDSPHDEFP